MGKEKKKLGKSRRSSKFTPKGRNHWETGATDWVAFEKKERVKRARASGDFDADVDMYRNWNSERDVEWHRV